ncbi:MAG TPA: efflux RND transporter periplasmic adaptor subunit [Victivallales bacterium]|nr:efflux RND transporter periplasmic adaptor subunit [Victivallales bacterium]
MSQNKIKIADKLSKKINPLIMSRLILCIVILLIGLVLFIIFSAMMTKPSEGATRDILKTLITIPAKTTDFIVKVDGYGTAKPSKTMRISSQVNGRIEYINKNLKDGNLVGKDELLTKIDKSDYQIIFQKAESDIKVFESEYAIQKQLIVDYMQILEIIKHKLDLEQKDYLRQKSLFQKKVVSSKMYEDSGQKLDEVRNSVLLKESDISKAKLQLDLIQANIEKAKFESAKAKLSIERSEIRSPINGRIKNKNININEYVNVGQVLFDIADDSSLTIPISLTSSEAAEIMDITPDKSVAYRHWFRYAKNTPVFIQWTEKPKDCKWEGKILRVEQFNPETRTVTVVVKATKFVGNKLNKMPLVDGMFCKVTLAGKTLSNVILIPWSALQLNSNIYIVNKNGIINETPVEIVGSSNGEAVIHSKFIQGDKIVVQQISRGIINGMKVNSVNADKIINESN